ncbi:MAG: DUF3696 domain-containing protein [Syntrophobacteraceae bacterium]
MITQLTIKSFKCFDSLVLPLAPLTLMTGFNASGKSTTLQPLLLLAQSLRSGSHSAELPLNGPLARLGSPGEVLNKANGNVVFRLEDGHVGVEWNLQGEDRSRGVALRIFRILITKGNKTTSFSDITSLEMLLPPKASSSARALVLNLGEIIFVSPVRLGTADLFPSPENPSPVHADVGVQGEFAPWWFQRFIDEEIDELRCHASDPAQTLRRQFNAWADQLFPSAQGNVLAIEKTNFVRLELRIGDTGEWRRPANTGYGLTYAFPIIVAGLLAKKGQILVIDSPEAHLHPMGQSEMGRFLAKIAAAGVQVLIETHSDHLLNGIRLAVRDQIIDPKCVAAHFFNKPIDAAAGSATIVSPQIDKFGNLSEWPEGFGDQAEKDLARLAGWN